MSVRAIEHCIAIVICRAALSACATQQIPPTTHHRGRGCVFSERLGL